MKIDQALLEEMVAELTAEIRAKQVGVLEKIGVAKGRDNYSFQMFNGLFGGKNNTYVDSVRTVFTDFNDFYSQWLRGVINEYEERTQRGPHPYHNALLLKDPEIESFVRLFLERNFYRNLNARTRLKPEEALWSVWFGFNVIFGLLIAPINRGGEWRIDRSEIRRADYDYWTIGHVFKEGLIDQARATPFHIPDLKAFESTYLSIFKQLSSSMYEKEIYERYIDYLKNSVDLEAEPFLIPEVRYAGLEKKHIYRLDFTVLNPHTKEYIGFEISPASSHMSIAGLKEKQKKVNLELKEKWDKEMKKRNEYFKTFSITTITFSDEMLADMDACWRIIEEVLSARSEEKTSIQDQMQRVYQIK